jgi:hypothetical protein
MRYRVGWLLVAATIGFASESQACEPIWARPVVLSDYSAAFFGKVESVDWFRGRVQVAQIRVLTGRPAKTAEVTFNNIPLTCGWQIFWPGTAVYVFEDPTPKYSWAAQIGDVSFDNAKKR